MIKVGISSCVMGDKVRFDGGHKKSGYVMAYLDKMFQLMPVCPEVGMGMPVPRPAIHVVEDENGFRLTDSKDIAVDHTDKLNSFYAAKAKSFAQLDGYIFAAKSPTCGVERIKVYNSAGELQHRKGQGMYVQLLRRDYPCLPIEEDGRLNDAGLRECFITKVYAHHRFRHDVLDEPSVGKLVNFHSRHKLLIMAYSPVAYQRLGRLVAHAGKTPLDITLDQYLRFLMEVLSKPTSRKKHANVLMHIQGYFKKDLTKEEKQELSAKIDRYRVGHLPLMAPITLIQHYLQKHPNQYLSDQVYFEPFPEELGLRA